MPSSVLQNSLTDSTVSGNMSDMEKKKLEDLMTVQEAADVLGLTVGRIRQMLRAEVIKGFKMGPRMWVIPIEEVVNAPSRRRGRLREESNAGPDKEG